MTLAKRLEAAHWTPMKLAYSFPHETGNAMSLNLGCREIEAALASLGYAVNSMTQPLSGFQVAVAVVYSVLKDQLDAGQLVGLRALKLLGVHGIEDAINVDSEVAPKLVMLGNNMCAGKLLYTHIAYSNEPKLLDLNEMVIVDGPIAVKAVSSSIFGISVDLRLLLEPLCTP